jgi:hypothetical protein
MRNKAKLGRPGVSGGSGGALAGADCAKRSQFRPRMGRQSRHGGDYAKQTQFARRAREWARVAGAGGPRRGVIMQNEPNLAGRTPPRRTKCAKRTQFGPGGGYQRDQRCKTNPILRNKASSRPLRRTRWTRKRQLRAERGNPPPCAGHTLFLPPTGENACQRPPSSYRLERS